MAIDYKKTYLDLLRNTLLGLTYADYRYDPGKGSIEQHDPKARENGEDWPFNAQSMAGAKRMLNVHKLIEQVEADKIPGDFVETGVWRGGVCIYAAGVYQTNNIKLKDRKIWVCDSFEGLPQPNEAQYPVDQGDTHFTAQWLKCDMDTVARNFASYNLLSDQIKFVKGFFSDTLPKMKDEIEQISILRLDGDMYESTIVALENLYPKLSVGGYVIVDDYGLPNCRKALEDYRKFHDIEDEYIEIDNSSVYFKKTNESDKDKIEHRFALPKSVQSGPVGASEQSKTTFSQPNQGASLSSQ